MKRMISLLLGVLVSLGLSATSFAESPSAPDSNPQVSISSRIAPRMSYEDKVRTIAGNSSWTSSKYYCVAGDYFGGGIEDPVKLTGKIQFSTTTDGPWSTLSTKALNYSAMTLRVEKKGYYRFVLSNTSSSSVTAECYVMVN